MATKKELQEKLDKVDSILFDMWLEYDGVYDDSYKEIRELCIGDIIINKHRPVFVVEKTGKSIFGFHYAKVRSLLQPSKTVKFTQFDDSVRVLKAFNNNALFPGVDRYLERHSEED